MDDVGARTMTKVGWRLIPFAMLLFIVNYLDRANVSFAALQMNDDLGFTPAVYGLGAGLFFLGYFLFQVPSNLILERVGARQWIARILVTWGLIATGMAWVVGVKSFYALRFLLGVAEAGFLPGIIFYLSRWFPAEHRAQALGLFMAATAVSNVIGAPLSTSLLSLDGWLSFRGWQMLFIAEGFPAVLLGLWVISHLTDRPEDATWLEKDEQRWLSRTLTAERLAKEAATRMTLRQGLTDRRVLMITLLCFCLVSGTVGAVFRLPHILSLFGGLSSAQTGVLTALPYLLAGIAMVWWGRHSDRQCERKWHLAAAALVGAAGLAASALLSTPALSFAALCAAMIGLWSTFGVFWAVPADFLCGTAAAGGFALINSFGALGGFTGPYLVGYIREQTGTFQAGLLVLAGFVLGAAVLSFLLRNEWRRLQPAAAD